MNEDEFAVRVKEHLRKRYDIPEVIRERLSPPDYYIEKEPHFKFPEGTKLKWCVRGSGAYPEVHEDVEGRIFIWSPTRGDPSEVIDGYLERESRRKRWMFDTFQLWDMICDRKKWKEVEKASKKLVDWLRHADEIAEELTRKSGIKIIFYIPLRSEGDRFHFIASFDSKGMNDEEKITMIDKAIDIVEEAANLL
ncbi:MAG: hypothetical protein HA496_07965 [Thaumarchaeota archaeon]|nr:hypothetical protein [Nitrososphaerota archaeon]